MVQVNEEYKSHFLRIEWMNEYNLPSLLVKIYICDFYFNNYNNYNIIIVLSMIQKNKKI